MRGWRWIFIDGNIFMSLPSVLTVSDAAAARVRELMARGGACNTSGNASDGSIIGLRIGISSTGCSGHSYKIDYARERRDYEEVIEDKGVCLFIDPAAVMFLIGAEMDYHSDTFESGFVFRNPNEKTRCGCGKSVGF